MTEVESAPLILASASHRRRQLMSEAGYEFTVVPPEVDESTFQTKDISPVEYAEQLALAKAKSIAQKYPDSHVIGADTIVDFRGRIIGKAAGAKEAEKITGMLFSSPHKVITGIAIVKFCDGMELVRSDSTTVYPKKMTVEQIADHIKGGSWRDKAGAYAIQETGDEFVEKIDGSLTNVMGLPMELLESLFVQLGISTDKRPKD